MANRVVELVARISADVAGDVGDKFDDVGGMARKMSDDVESSTSRGARGIERMGGASEGLDDKFGRAAGAAGALSSGADLIGNEKASVALQAMALATDFFSGVGQLGILVTEGLSVAQAENVVVSKASAVATKAQAVAQGALNAVMSANPILLVVIAIAALVAGFILAYKHSSTFREIVQKTGKLGAAGVHLISDAVGDVVDWLGRVISKFGVVGDVVHAYVFVIKTEIGLVVDVIAFVVDKVQDAGRAWKGFKDDAVDAARVIADKAGDFFRKLTAPIRTARDAVQDLFDLVGDLIDAISHIHIPHPDLNPFNGRTATGRPGATVGGGGTTVEVTVDMPVTITLPVSGDPAVSAQAIVTALTQLATRLGVSVADLLRTELAAAA